MAFTSRPSGTSKPSATSKPSGSSFPGDLPVVSMNQEFSLQTVLSYGGIVSFEQEFSLEADLGYGGYSPESEGDLVLWFDFDDPSSYTVVGSDVTAIVNKASGVTWTPSNPIPYEATGWGGTKPCIHPTTISHIAMSTEAAVLAALDCPNAAKPMTLIAYLQPDSATGGGIILGVGNSGVSSASTRTWGLRNAANQWEHAQTIPHTTTTQVRSTAGIVTTNMTRVAWVSPGVGVAFRMNNGAPDPNNTTCDSSYIPGTGPNRVALNCRPDNSPDGPAQWRLREVLLFSDAKDASALTRLDDYMVGKD